MSSQKTIECAWKAYLHELSIKRDKARIKSDEAREQLMHRVFMDTMYLLIAVMIIAFFLRG